LDNTVQSNLQSVVTWPLSWAQYSSKVPMISGEATSWDCFQQYLQIKRSLIH